MASMARTRFLTRATGRCASAPADALSTVSLNPAARLSGITTPCAPAASEVRTIAPRLWGSSMPSSSTSRPWPPLAASKSSSSTAGFAAPSAATPWCSRVPVARSSCWRSSNRTGTPRDFARRTTCSTRSPCRPLAINMRSSGRPAERASSTAWNPVIQFIRSPDAALVQRSAEFKRALPGALDSHCERQARRRIQQQNYAVEFPLARPACQRHAKRMENRATAVRQDCFEALDNLLQAVGIHIAACQYPVGELANHLARPFARKDSLVLGVLHNRARVVAENERKQAIKLGAIASVRAQKLGCATQPALKRSVWFCQRSSIEPAALAQNHRNLNTGDRTCKRQRRSGRGLVGHEREF